MYNYYEVTMKVKNNVQQKEILGVICEDEYFDEYLRILAKEDLSILELLKAESVIETISSR